MIDTHCHLNAEEFSKDFNQVLENTISNGINQVLIPGYNQQSSQCAVALANQNPVHIIAAVGIHPNYAVDDDKNNIADQLTKFAGKSIKAIGEVGLDFYRKFTSKESQFQTFNQMLGLAELFNLPICIHSRNSDDEIVQVLDNWLNEVPHQTDCKGVFHAYEGSASIADWGKEHHFLFGIGGAITYKNNLQLRNKIKTIGLDSIILETDSPYLAPVPYRGKRNEPKYLPIILSAVSKILEIPIQTVEDVTDNNAKRLFCLD